MAVLELNHLSITYDGVHNAVDDVSFSVEKGSIVCIVGESGSGKSTLLHAILRLNGMNTACKGSIKVFDEDVLSMNQKQLMELRGKRVSMVFQDTGRYMNPIAKIGKQYTTFLKKHHYGSAAECLALEKDMLTRVQLSDADRVLQSYPFELSGGMRQRVGIAMAMSLRPELLLADEPTSALDVTVQAQVVYEMMELRRRYGTTIVIVTHNMGVAAYMSDYIGVMQNGRLVEWGTADEVIQTPKQEYTKSLLAAVIELDDERLAE